MGSRQAGNEKATAWAAEAGEAASEGTFADAAAFGELVFNATSGTASLEALGAGRAQNLAGKVLLDVANPLDFSAGCRPTLAVCNDARSASRSSAPSPRQGREGAEHRQRRGDGEPRLGRRARTTSSCAATTTTPRRASSSSSQSSAGRRRRHRPRRHHAARGTEMYLPLWLRLMGATGSPGSTSRSSARPTRPTAPGPAPATCAGAEAWRPACAGAHPGDGEAGPSCAWLARRGEGSARRA